MGLETTLADITARLRQGRFPNEQAISQGAVLRLLQDLGWDTWDPAVVWPEFRTGEGRADFALCHPPSKPLIFIEVKQPGLAEVAIRQALEYAFHTGVPFIVLTDGKTWSFYLPAEQGSYEDRRVYKLDLFERSVEEAAETLRRYLGWEVVQSGESIESARREYRSRSRRSQARAAIPGAWRELVESGDEDLFELLAAAVESKAGFRPEPDDVSWFLAGLVAPEGVGGTHVAAPTRRRPTPIELPRSSRIVPPGPPSGAPAEGVRRYGVLRLRDKELRYANAKEAMVLVLQELANDDPSFLQRCSTRPEMSGRKRRYIGRSAEELYPDRPDLRLHKAELPGGWLVSTNLNNQLKLTIIRVAAEVAGLEMGKDVSVSF